MHASSRRFTAERKPHLDCARSLTLGFLITRLPFALTFSSSLQKIAGLNILSCLLYIEDEDNINRRLNFGNDLRETIIKAVSNEPNVAKKYDANLIECVCTALGHFVLIASTNDIEFVEAHFFKQTGEWIKDSKNEMRRLAAVCILQVLLTSAPALFFNEETKARTLEDIWDAARDTKQVIREKASKALGTFLTFIHRRGQRANLHGFTSRRHSQRAENRDYYGWCLDEVEGILGEEKCQDNQVHGSLLVAIELINHPSALQNSEGDSRLCVDTAKSLHDVMKSRYENFAELIMKKRSSGNGLIQSAVIASIPALATFSPKCFVKTSADHAMSNLECSVNFLKTCVESSSNGKQDTALLNLGQLCLILGKF